LHGLTEGAIVVLRPDGYIAHITTTKAGTIDTVVKAMTPMAE